MVVRRLRDDELQHYGVKGMKWRHHKAQTDTKDKDAKARQTQKDKDQYNEQEKARERARDRYAKSVASGKARSEYENRRNVEKAEEKLHGEVSKMIANGKARSKHYKKMTSQPKERGYKEHINERARKTVGSKVRKAYTNSSAYLKKKGEKMARKYQDMPLPKRSGK